MTAQKLCLYCGSRDSSVEHVISEALGCKETISSGICGPCNSTIRPKQGSLTLGSTQTCSGTSGSRGLTARDSTLEGNGIGPLGSLVRLFVYVRSGNRPGIQRDARVAGKTRRNGARGLSEASTPRSISADTTRRAWRSTTPAAAATSPRGSSPR
jgi:hypothetical protein